jgi:hypothetical protein
MQLFLLGLLGAAILAFAIKVIYDAFSHFIGYNSKAPSAWARLKVWWPGFVKRHLVDDYPLDGDL